MSDSRIGMELFRISEVILSFSDLSSILTKLSSSKKFLILSTRESLKFLDLSSSLSLKTDSIISILSSSSFFHSSAFPLGLYFFEILYNTY